MSDATDPDRFVAHALDLLAASAADRDGPFRDLALATATPDGPPGLRTVVLRRVDRPGPDAVTLEFHTDRLAGKRRELARHPGAALLGWCPRARLQLRIDGRAAIHAGDALCRDRWAALSERARATYGLAPPPGAPVPDRVPLLADDDARFERFAVVRIEALRLDLLRLGDGGARTRAIRDCRPGARAAFVCP